MGGGTIFKAVTKADMLGLKMLVPPAALRERFNTVATPMLEQSGTLTNHNISLRQTRDLLLPKLISGELDVSELDIEVPEEAA